MGPPVRLNTVWLKAFGRDKSAVTALEYGLIAAVIGTVIAVGFSTYAGNLKRLAAMW